MRINRRVLSMSVAGLTAVLSVACFGCSKGSGGPAAVATPTPVAAATASATAQPDVAGSAASPATAPQAGEAPLAAQPGSGTAGGSAPSAGANPAVAGAPTRRESAGAPRDSREPVSGPEAAAPPPPRIFTLSSSTPISIYTTTELSTKTSKPGDVFTGTLAHSIVDRDWVIAKEGAPVDGVVLNSDPGGRVKGVASITVALRRLTLADGRRLDISTSAFTQNAKKTHGKDAAKIIGGAGVGALIGALAGGRKGAAIGAGAGGAAGTGVVLATRGDPATIPRESRLSFRVKTPVRITKQQRIP